jgi:hypothetical protein
MAAGSKSVMVGLVILGVGVGVVGHAAFTGLRETRAARDPGSVRGGSLSAEVAELRAEVASLRRELAVPHRGGAAAPAAPSGHEAAPARSQGDRTLAGLVAITQGERQLAVKDAVAELARRGDAVVPEIVALLKSGRDQDYGGGFSFGGNMFTGGYPRLRTVLIDALRQIGSPAAKAGLLEALAGSEDALDYRDLLLMYGRSRDEQMVNGISAMIPGVLQLMKAGGGEDAALLDRYVTGWIGRHNPEGTEDLLEDLVLESLRVGKSDGGAFAVLLDSSPERAFRLAEQMRSKDDDGQSFRRVAGAMRGSHGDVSLASIAKYCELVFAKLDPGVSERAIFYSSLPYRLDRSIKSASARAADGRVLLEFLQRRQREETSESARVRLKYALDRLEKKIAECEKQ